MKNHYHPNIKSTDAEQRLQTKRIVSQRINQSLSHAERVDNCVAVKRVRPKSETIRSEVRSKDQISINQSRIIMPQNKVGNLQRAAYRSENRIHAGREHLDVRCQYEHVRQHKHVRHQHEHARHRHEHTGSSRRYNTKVIFELFVLGLLIAGILTLLFSGNYQNYVTGKSFGWLIFLASALTMMFFTAWQQRYQKSSDAKNWQVIILLIPILLILIPHKNVSTISYSTASDNAIVANQQEDDGLRRNTQQTQLLTPKGVRILKPEEQQAARDAVTPEGYTPAPKTPSQQSIDGEKNEPPADGIIKVADVNFYGWSAELLREPDKYLGMEVTIKGFILTEYPDQSGNDFGLVRMCMACCAADMFPFGLIVNDDDNIAHQQSYFSSGAWVQLTGTLEKAQIDGKNKVFLKLKEIQPAEKTQPEYVIPVY